MSTRLLRNSLSCFFWGFVALYVVYVLWLPVFPSTDGPVHLYYADVTKQLISDQHAYGGFFFIRHFLPPYSLHTYILAGLTAVVSSVLAEKILICVYICGFCFGVRFLAKALGQGWRVASLAALPIVLHKLVYLGFYNFDLGVAVMLWFVGFWVWHHDNLAGWRSIGFVALTVLLMVTHPVPLGVALLFLALHVTFSVLAESRRAADKGWARWRTALRSHGRQMLHAGVACLSLCYVLSVRGQRDVCVARLGDGGGETPGQASVSTCCLLSRCAATVSLLGVGIVVHSSWLLSTCGRGSDASPWSRMTPCWRWLCCAPLYIL